MFSCRQINSPIRDSNSQKIITLCDNEPLFCLYITSGFLILMPNQRRHQCSCVNMYTSIATQCELNPIKSPAIWQTLAEIPPMYTLTTHVLIDACGYIHSLCVKLSLSELKIIGTLALKMLQWIHFIIRVTSQLIQDVFFFSECNVLPKTALYYAIYY